MIEIKNLNITLSKKNILNDINIKIEKGQVVGLLGPTGSGKTTLLKSIAGIIPPSHGSLTIKNMTPCVETKKILSMMTEKNEAPPMKVKDIINFYEMFFPDFSKARFKELESEMGIDFPKHQNILNLSKGTLQLLRFILCISRDSEVFILDEPLSGLDTLLREKVNDQILSMIEEERTFIISTHLIHDVENLIDRAVFIKDGKIVLDEDCDDLRSSTGLSIEDSFKEVLK